MGVRMLDLGQTDLDQFDFGQWPILACSLLHLLKFVHGVGTKRKSKLSSDTPVYQHVVTAHWSATTCSFRTFGRLTSSLAEDFENPLTPANPIYWYISVVVDVWSITAWQVTSSCEKFAARMRRVPKRARSHAPAHLFHQRQQTQKKLKRKLKKIHRTQKKTSGVSSSQFSGDFSHNGSSS